VYSRLKEEKEYRKRCNAGRREITDAEATYKKHCKKNHPKVPVLRTLPAADARLES
jgi:hypothetical protein